MIRDIIRVILKESSYGIEFIGKDDVISGDMEKWRFSSKVPYKGKDLEYIIKYYGIHLGDSNRWIEVEFEVNDREYNIGSILNGVDALRVLDTVLEGLEVVLREIEGDRIIIKIVAIKGDTEDGNKRLSLYSRYINKRGIKGWEKEGMSIKGEVINIELRRVV